MKKVAMMEIQTQIVILTNTIEFIEIACKLSNLDYIIHVQSEDSITAQLKNEIKKLKLHNLDISILSKPVVLKIPSRELTLRNFLYKEEVYTYGDLLSNLFKYGRNFFRFRQNLGWKSIKNIEDILSEMGLIHPVTCTPKDESYNYKSIYEPFVKFK